MKIKTVTIVGIGALGSHVAMLLRNLDVELRVIDFDRVEQKNVQSQFHLKPNVGKSKVQSLSGAMQLFFGVKIAGIGNKLTPDNADQILKDSALLIDCLDNGAARKLVQQYARKNAVPCLHGALAADGGFGRVVWDERFVIDSEAGVGAATCENGEHLPFIAITSSYLARSAQEFSSSGLRVGYEITPGGTMRT